jgi:hypothetical protein
MSCFPTGSVAEFIRYGWVLPMELEERPPTRSEL